MTPWYLYSDLHGLTGIYGFLHMSPLATNVSVVIKSIVNKGNRYQAIKIYEPPLPYCVLNIVARYKLCLREKTCLELRG